MITATEFWNWFEANNISYFRQHDDIATEAVDKRYDDFLARLHEYDEHLYFEIGGNKGEPHELIITASSDVDYFERADELIAAAPTIENWTFIALIPPLDIDYKTHFEDVELYAPEVWFLPLDSKRNPKQIGLRICLPNYNEVKDSKWFEAAVYRMLETALGERVFALDVHYVDFAPLPAEPEKHGMIELRELSAFIKWKKKKIAAG